MIPFWAKDSSIGNKLINAKAETIHEKPSFKNAFRSRRCLVLSDGFFEWKKTRDKIPYRITLKKGEPFAMAGIWEKWNSPEGLQVRSFSIITTGPNALMEKIHDRMPVILPSREERTWLGNTGPDELLSLLKPYPAGEMEAYPVSRLVNNPKNDTPEIFALSKE